MPTWDRASVAAVFQEFDENGDGKIQENELRQVLKRIRPATFCSEQVDCIMQAADCNKDGFVDLEEFLSWLWQDVSNQELMQVSTNDQLPSAARICGDSIKLLVLRVSGEEIVCLNVAASEVVLDVKRRIREAGGPPAAQQQLLIDGCVVEDDSTIVAAGEAKEEVICQLVRLSPPPLRLQEFESFVQKTCDASEEMTRSLEEFFDGHDINAQLRERLDMECSDSGDDGEDELAADKSCGTPLWRLAHVSAPAEQLASVAQWLLSRGASIDVKSPPEEECTMYDEISRSVMEEYLHQKKATLIRVLLNSGFQPTLMSLCSALPRDCDLIFSFTHVHTRDDAVFSLARLQENIKTVEEFCQFMLLLKTEMMPALAPLPADLFCHKLQGERTLLESLEGSNHCWSFALLVDNGADWSKLPPPREPEDDFICILRDECPEKHELLAAAALIESFAFAALAGAKVRMAIWKDDAEEVRRLLTEKNSDPSWCHVSSNFSESLLITACRAGANPSIISALLNNHRLDPIRGVYEYGWHGSFQLWSALGWIGAEFYNEYTDVPPELLEDLVLRLSRHPLSDLSFGKIHGGERGGGSRAACDIATCLDMYEYKFFGVLALVRAGAPIPVGDADARLMANGGQFRGFENLNTYEDYSSEDETASPQTRWFCGLKKVLEEFVGNTEEFLERNDMVDVSENDLRQMAQAAKSDLSEQQRSLEIEMGGANDDDAQEQINDALSDLRKRFKEATQGLHKYHINKKQMDSAAELLHLLRRIGAGFNVAELSAFPTPDKLLTRTLSCWTCDEVSKLPEHALGVILDFLPLWATKWSRPDCTLQMCLGNIDVDHCDSGRPLQAEEVTWMRFGTKFDKWWNGEEVLAEETEEHE